MAESLSIVIPVYHSEAILPDLYRQLVASLEEIGGPFEIIFVEDCGGDKSWEVIKNLASRDARVRGLKLSRNYGQHSAILCGIRAARHDVIVTMDDDLQHPPDQIALLLSELGAGHDVVYGVPQTEQHGSLRNFASRITKLASSTFCTDQSCRVLCSWRRSSPFSRECSFSRSEFLANILHASLAGQWASRPTFSGRRRRRPRGGSRAEWPKDRIPSTREFAAKTFDGAERIRVPVLVATDCALHENMHSIRSGCGRLLI
jgi:glycosyltransferase involved in cell wall biosynthesis